MPNINESFVTDVTNLWIFSGLLRYYNTNSRRQAPDSRLLDQS